jgi:hypothetical protein
MSVAGGGGESLIDGLGHRLYTIEHHRGIAAYAIWNVDGVHLPTRLRRFTAASAAVQPSCVS